MTFSSSVPSRLLLALALAGVATTAGCKKTVTKDSEATLQKVRDLESQLAEKDTYIQKLRDQNAELERGGVSPGGPGEWVFTIEGDALVIKARPTGGGGPDIDEGTATKLSEQFITLVQRSRGAIQKCYEQALKKSTGLQARTVNLKVSASFGSGGKFSKVTFSPELPDVFDTCLRSVAGKWTMTGMSQSMTFQASVKLTPT